MAMDQKTATALRAAIRGGVLPGWHERLAGLAPDGRGGATEHEYSETAGWGEPGTEQPRAAFGPDHLVKLRLSVFVTRRGSEISRLPKGEEGWIRRDWDGTGRRFVVYFPEHNLDAVVSAEALTL